MDINADMPEKPTKDAAIALANHLLDEFRIPTQVADIQDISSSLFVVLYESLFSDRLPGVIRQPTSRDDEIHNSQVVIDVLATDVIHDNLNHIQGADIVAGDLTAIYNLLDIFSHLLEYVMNKIESDHDDTRSVGEDPVRTPSYRRNGYGASKKTPPAKEAKTQSASNMAKEVKSVPTYGSYRSASLNKNENRKAYDDHKVISHEEFYAMTYGGLPKYQNVGPLSPIRVDQSWLGQKTIDSEFETDTSGRLPGPRPSQPKIAWDEKPAPSRVVQSVVDTAVTATSTKEKTPKTAAVTAIGSVHSALSSSMPALSQSQPAQTQDPLRSTVGPVTYHTHPTPESDHSDREYVRKNLPSSYQDLKRLVIETAAMTKMALSNSEKDGTTSQRRNVPRPHSVQDTRLAQKLNLLGVDEVFSGRKKVAFASAQFEDSDSRRDLPGGDKFVGDAQDKYFGDTRGEFVGDTRTHRFDQGHELRQQHRLESIDGMSVDQTQMKLKSARSEAQTKAFVKHLALNRQSELGAAHLALKGEDMAIRKKHELLRQFYEKDHDEFKEDVEYMLGREREKAAETEEKYVQKCAKAASKQKMQIKSKGMTSHSGRRKSRMKATRHKTSDRGSSTSPPVTIESEEDLLPFLMDEFPYLHLSGHTWHELWRKGIQQIEALTRAYQEIGRKKSRAQNQLSEAAQKHNLLSEIMRKQLDQSRRMQEIKEQRLQQVQMRNKNHEKRIQSARARRYYNEYQVRARAKVLKRRTKEEMVFRELFKDTLNIQRERVKDIYRYASDQRKRQEQQRQNEIDSLENYYHNEFDLLAERLARERLETDLREAAQRQMMDRMKRELRKKMESEIKEYQEQVLRCDDDVHYRQADADRLKQYLHQARYSVKS